MAISFIVAFYFFQRGCIRYTVLADTDDGRKDGRRDGTDGTDGQRTDDDDGTDDGTDDDGRRRRRTDGRTEDDDGDGTDGRDGRTTTGRTGRNGQTRYVYIYIVPKFQIRHWDQYSNVPVCRPRDDVSGHPQ